MKLTFSVNADVAAVDALHPEIHALYALWNNLAREDGLPRLSSFDWQSLDMVDDLMLVERVGEASYLYHAYGANISRAAGFDMTGKTTDSFDSRAGRFFVATYTRCLDERRPLYATNPALHAALVSSWERLLLPFFDDSGKPHYVLGYNRPASFRHELLESVMNATSGGIVGLAGTMDSDTALPRFSVVTLNKQAEELLGPRDRIIGKHLDDVMSFGPDDPGGEAYVMTALAQTMEPLEWSRTTDDEPDGCFRVEVRPFAHGAVMTLTDITELKRTESTLNELAMTDSLTGIANRRRFVSVAQAELKRAQRNETTAALMMFDIDHFKLINDNYGHPAGDAVLIGIANRVQGMLREQDLFARIGGEEFGILLPETTLEQAIGITARVRELLSIAPFEVELTPISITCSFGVTDSSDGVPFDEMFQRADSSLYAAKHAGRDTVRIYDSSIGHTISA